MCTSSAIPTGDPSRHRDKSTLAGECCQCDCWRLLWSANAAGECQPWLTSGNGADGKMFSLGLLRCDAFVE
jgi:hypothetical protein